MFCFIFDMPSIFIVMINEFHRISQLIYRKLSEEELKCENNIWSFDNIKEFSLANEKYENEK